MGKHVLVVEDNEHLGSILTSVLTHFGYEPVLACTGAEAINSVIANQPDVVLLDLGLPDMPGYRVARAILNYPGFAHTPIIGCSAYSSSEERETALKAGMVEYLEKPIKAEELRETIEHFL
jgi:CheY-like chemotaxis protein